MTDLTPAHEALLDRLADYRNRLETASIQLRRMATDAAFTDTSESDRLEAKRSGVMLAHSYFAEIGAGPNMDQDPRIPDLDQLLKDTVIRSLRDLLTPCGCRGMCNGECDELSIQQARELLGIDG